MRTHRSDLVSLVMGIIFVALGVRFLQPGAQIWSIDWSWLWPAALLLGGVLVLASARSRDRDREHDRERDPAPATDESPLEDSAGPVAP